MFSLCWHSKLSRHNGPLIIGNYYSCTNYNTKSSVSDLLSSICRGICPCICNIAFCLIANMHFKSICINGIVKFIVSFVLFSINELFRL